MKNIFKQNYKNYFWHLIFLVISAIIYGLILANRSPNFLRTASMALRTGFGLVIPMTILILYFAFRIPNRVGDLIGLIVTLGLFAMPLAGIWASGQSQSTILSGIIPLFDAEYYYIDALRLLDGNLFSIFSARRPLFPALFSVLLAITGRNLMFALSIMTAISGLACYYTAREIQQTHGTEIAVFILIILFLFIRAHSGISMSESFGLALGSLGFGLLWRSTTSKKILDIWMGLLTTTLALNTRAGAFFILPLLILWAGWFMRDKKLISWKIIFISSSAVVMGFAFNLLLTRLIAVPSGVPFANFSYTLYGLASGGKSWAYIFEVHPEVLNIQEPEQSRRIYQLAFELIRANPLQTIQGALFNWEMLFSDTWYNVYAYIGGENWSLTIIVRWGMYLLSLVGFFSWSQNRKDPINNLVMASAIGLFISVPFLPPTDAYRMRPYAASIIVLGALPAMGLYYFISQIKQYFLNSSDSPTISSTVPTLIYSSILITVALIGPVFIKSNAQPMIFQTNPCESGLEKVVVKLDRGTYVILKKQNESFLDWMPNFHIGTFKENSHSLADSSLITWAESIDPPKTIFATLDYNTQGKVLVVIPSSLIPNTDSVFQICGEWEADPQLSIYGIFYGRKIQILHPG